ncbi:AAA family ATPase [Aeromicrobium stalagmiti]|uniref:AAA family ATPase n=1 Tax=Aeromicrobium stalagmiti TaxID=2738988 RepID=UPI001569BE05|nr:AAA family ATPase [Aeromicrobium stalagmiti]NRQ50408.1 AAA family ATPase [Aeromicrobium stalagmiti]
MTTADDVTFERSINQVYLEALERKLAKAPAIAQYASTHWTKAGAARSPKIVRHPLVGRIGLVSADEDLGSAFYVGPRFIALEAGTVLSWDSRFARQFFVDDETTNENLAVRRTLVSRGDDVVAVSDEWRCTVDPSPFHTVSTLTVPAAPTRRVRPTERPSPPVDSATPPLETVTAPAPARQTCIGLPPMRAAEAVAQIVSAPRTQSLTSVLATLQPDQYRLVTWDPIDNLVVQGHPGTGKTVVAIHRAVFLVGEERGADRASRVHFVGPTAGHVRHVTPLLDSFGVLDQVEISDISSLMLRLAGSTTMAHGAVDGADLDVRWEAGDFAVRAKNRLVLSHKPVDIESIYEAARSMFAEVHDAEWKQWLRDLPRFANARRKARFAPFMAWCGVLANPVGPWSCDHMVIDEAQDVRPLEWRVLDAINTGQLWTLVGDVNQRRVDHTHPSWEKLGNDLALDDGETPLKPQVMRRGYRSTEQIMVFANKLLPREQRVSNCVQQGPPVKAVRRSGSDTSLDRIVIDTLEDLLPRHLLGTTAIITTTPGSLTPLLIKAGWSSADGPRTQWRRGSQTLSLHEPTSSRGIEFDAVIVVEPANFPAGFAGRHGPLYTSLTRANRELIVVHEKPLPDPLRRANRT